MTAKEYFSQAYQIDVRINSKMEQVASLRDMATKATQTLSDMPGAATKNTHQMEDIIIKMVDLENEINDDIDRLIDLKRSIIGIIQKLTDAEQQSVLELRYVNCMSWQQICTEMGYSRPHVFRIHNQAMNNVVIPDETDDLE